MKYANTQMDGNTEFVSVVLPLSMVPGFDPENPPQANTYAVPDDVQPGWVKSGGSFVPPQPPQPTVPQKVTRRQFKLALLDIGLLDDVEAIIAASNDRALQINWAEALDFERSNPFIAQMAAALNKTAAEVDALFVLASGK